MRMFWKLDDFDILVISLDANLKKEDYEEIGVLTKIR
jgi:hypothetical protein